MQKVDAIGNAPSHHDKKPRLLLGAAGVLLLASCKPSVPSNITWITFIDPTRKVAGKN